MSGTRPPWLFPVIIGAGVALGVLAARAGGWFEASDLWWHDWLVRAHRARQPTSQSVALVGISEEDIRQLATWPPSDQVVADLLTRVLNGGPRAVGLDLYRDIPVPPGTDALGAVLTGDPRIVAVEKFGGDGAHAPAVLAGSDQVGFNDILVDAGGVVRRALLFLDAGEEVASSLALQLALRYLWVDGVAPKPAPGNPGQVQLGATVIPPLETDTGPYQDADAGGYQYLLDLAGGPQPFPLFGLSEVLSDGFDPAVFTDQVVLIGVTASSVKDHFYTPWGSGRGQGQHSYGVVLHAFAVDQLIRAATGSARFLIGLEGWQNALWVLLWGILGGAVAGRMRSPARVALAGSLGVLVVTAVAFPAFGRGVWVPVTTPAAAWGLAILFATAYLADQDRRQRAALMNLFSRHVSPEIADEIWAQRDALLEDGRPRPRELTATVLFLDVRGYTTVSERMDPRALVGWLNSYMEPLTDLVGNHRGVVDDYAGDGLKANFGVPFDRTSADEVREDARNAARCALAMGRAVEAVNARWGAAGFPPAGIRVGLHTGPLVAGAVGSARRMKYTTMGDTVNTAARLENYDKELAREDPCRIILSDATRDLLGPEVPVELVGELTLKGKSEIVRAYRVLRERRSCDADQPAQNLPNATVADHGGVPGGGDPARSRVGRAQ